MDNSITLELRIRQVEADDTAGYWVSEAPKVSQGFHVLSPVAIKLNLPDLAARGSIIVEDKQADVSGFRMMEEMTKEEGQAGPRNPYGLLTGLAVVVGEVFLGGMRP